MNRYFVLVSIVWQIVQTVRHIEDIYQTGQGGQKREEAIRRVLAAIESAAGRDLLDEHQAAYAIGQVVDGMVTLYHALGIFQHAKPGA